MHRRSFLSLAAAGAAQVHAEIAQRTESPVTRYLSPKQGRNPFRVDPSKPKPNIFVITADMVTPDHYHRSRTLHRDMNLPSLRSLAADGVTFTNAFCASPLCAPARAAFATGRYTYITANGERAHDGHETVLRDSDVIFQEYLKAAGYTTKHAGKGHLGTQKFIDAFGENDQAWDRWAPPVQDDESYLTYLRRLGIKPARYKRQIRGLQQDRKRPGIALGGWVEQSDGKPFPIEAQYSWYLAERAIEKLDAAIAQGGPMYLQLDFFDPHQPFVIPSGLEERERELRRAMTLPDSYRVWNSRSQAPATEPKVYDFYRRNWGIYSPETMLEYRVAHALQFEIVDRAVGHFLDAVKKRGLYDHAVVLFTSDHGEMNGRRGLVDKGVYLHPDVLRVPLIIKPVGKPATMSVEAPVCHMDIAPTLLSMTGIEPMARLDGIPLQDHLAGTPVAADRDLLFECGWHVGVNFACATQMRRSDGSHLLYTYNLSSTADELFDMNSTDAVNLAADERHQTARKEMIAKLGGILQRDPRWLGYWHSFRIDRYFELPPFEDADPQLQSGRAPH